MKKEWFFDRFCGRQFAALVEDGRLAEFSVEREDYGSIVGNVYKGKVVNVLSGMNAAFIACGLHKNCYLSMEETYTDYTKYDGTLVETNAKPLKLKVGDEILVQVTKPPRGNKGAKVTTNLSLVGKHIIYLPNTDFLGISRKITDEKQREKILKSVEKMRASENEGFIIRTQAPLATQKQLKNEWEYLKKRGMGRGANEGNVIALNDAGDGTLNKLIWPDEFVRHKIIDAIGDMFTSGGFVCGDLESFKGSHALNNLVLRKLFSNPENYEII